MLRTEQQTAISRWIYVCLVFGSLFSFVLQTVTGYKGLFSFYKLECFLVD